MKTLAALLGAAAIAMAGAPAAADTLQEKGEARLAKMIEGRVAGDPVSCIPAMNSNRLTIIEHVGVVYDAGRTIYVARADRPETLDRFETLVIDRHGSTLCRTDMTRTVDLTLGQTTGIVFFSEFVPYTKPDAG